MCSLDKYDEILYKIVGSAFDVMHELHGGLAEAVYEDALCRELDDRLLIFDEQPEIEIIYKGKPLSKRYRIDILVEDEVIIELKAVDKILSEHRAQLFNYLRLTKKPIGVLINFGIKEVQVERYCYDAETNDIEYYPSRSQSNKEIN